MKITVKLVQKDLIKAVLLHYEPKHARKIAHNIFYFLFLTFFITAMVYQSITNGLPIIYTLPILIIAFIPLLFRFVLLPLQGKNMFQSQKEFQSPMEFEFTDAGIRIDSVFSTSNIPWTEIIKFKENKDLFLLYYTANCFYILPKRFIGDLEQVEYIKSCIPQKSSPKNIAIQKNVRTTNLITLSITFLIVIIIIIAKILG